MEELQDLKKIFLDETLDKEVYDDNLEMITVWEDSLLKNEALLSWQQHDITKEIISKAKQTDPKNADRLSEDSTLTNEQRNELFAKQDAMKWFISLAGGNPKGEIQEIKKQIKEAVSKGVTP